MPADQKPVDQVKIRMYKLGTGDCFVLKFLQGNKVTFKILIDCGCWNGSKSRLRPFIEEIKRDVDEHIDVLAVTHEHKDHVLGFEVGEDLFADGTFQADQIWMAWTEKDTDSKVKKWKRDYGQKRRSLALAAEKLSETIGSEAFRNEFRDSRHEAEILAVRQRFSEVLTDFAELHVSKSARAYIGGLAGMTVVKEAIADKNISYYSPGDIIEDLPGLEGVRIFVLGPPTLHSAVKQEHGEEGESYQHNKELGDSDLFLRAIDALDEGDPSATVCPFDDSFVAIDAKQQAAYDKLADAWRRIDHDWLFSSGAFALRMNSLTNNLSLALAIEFVDSGKVLLFPGDAEFGSWKSWQNIQWDAKVPELTTEKLLNRVVFYKVAHHLSHNGTARSVGLDQMKSPDLVAMATLDFDVISSGWKSTMPNRHLLKDLLEKTKGRTLIMNTKDLFYDLEDREPLIDKIAEFRRRMNAAERKKFDTAVTETELFIEYTLTV